MQTEFNFTFDRKTREDRKSVILCIVNDTPGLTTRMIAKRLGLKKTPYVREMIVELIAHDLIHYRWENMTNGARAMVFYPGPEPPANYDPDWAENTGRPYPDDELPGPKGGLEDLQHQLEDHPDWPLPSDFDANPL
jgi:hypothetical protein